MDILGVYGIVAPDLLNSKLGGSIVSLGFVENLCPVREALTLEKTIKKNAIETPGSKVDIGLAIALGSCLVTAGCALAIYCCLKNRGRLCKKGAETNDPSPISNDSTRGPDIVVPTID